MYRGGDLCFRLSPCEVHSRPQAVPWGDWEDAGCCRAWSGFLLIYLGATWQLRVRSVTPTNSCSSPICFGDQPPQINVFEGTGSHTPQCSLPHGGVLIRMRFFSRLLFNNPSCQEPIARASGEWLNKSNQYLMPCSQDSVIRVPHDCG